VVSSDRFGGNVQCRVRGRRRLGAVEIYDLRIDELFHGRDWQL
jgi:hypothetical protein